MPTTRVPEPPLTDDITASALDPEVRRDLRSLQRDTAERVARHLVAAGTLVDEDPERALAHARFARSRASRIAVVREAAGIAAYHAGEWTEALGELRAARRMGGGPGHLAVMADIERALGRPERAIELSRGPDVRALDKAESIELAIVAAGARRDLGELDAAVVSLQIAELTPERREPWSPRLFYAYADNLLAAGRESDALQWFIHAADADETGETDADRRIAELTGEPLPDDDIEFGIEGGEDENPAGAEADDSDVDGDDDPRPVVDAEVDQTVTAGAGDPTEDGVEDPPLESAGGGRLVGERSDEVVTDPAGGAGDPPEASPAVDTDDGAAAGDARERPTEASGGAGRPAGDRADDGADAEADLPADDPVDDGACRPAEADAVAENGPDDAADTSDPVGDGADAQVARRPAPDGAGDEPSDGAQDDAGGAAPSGTVVESANPAAPEVRAAPEDTAAGESRAQLEDRVR